MCWKHCILPETSQMPNARFQAAGAIGDAAIREWGILTDDNKRCLILWVFLFEGESFQLIWEQHLLMITIIFLHCRFCLNYVMEHANSPDGYVQSKVSAVAARLLKRGWLVNMFLPTLAVQCQMHLLCLALCLVVTCFHFVPC